MVKGQRARLDVGFKSQLDVGFKSQRKNILSHFGGLRYRLFYPVPKTQAIDTTFGVPVQETGTKRQSQPMPMALFLVV